ncbi:uncharacterized protein LOC130999893 isoform X2 [Salvia miltiorrhiza]|uniref:uncharacterized protein LOC130999893 isoform X2 n=1 Tax=Salvia miltiorrhiza TaxID=226208 RepID=UPI0025AD687F|nr:uncharacterized protein LOC130999893 isoform X2 [Salvia miltiorrhiza]
MDAAELEEVLRVFDESLSQIKWRLKPSSKSRLQTDILALCSRMRPCIMVDYGGKMPELGNHLCAFLEHCKKESSIFKLLHVVVVDDMVYLVEARALADFVESSLETALLFVDLETDPPKMMTQAEESPAMTQLLSAQKLFSSVFQADGVSSDHLQRHETNGVGSSRDGDAASESPGMVDLSYCLRESDVTIPTLNGCDFAIDGCLVTPLFICLGRTTSSVLYIISLPSLFTSIKYSSPGLVHRAKDIGRKN